MLNRIKKYFSKDPLPAIALKRITKLENRSERTELFGNQSRVDHIQILEKLNSLEVAIKVIEGIQTTEARLSKKRAGAIQELLDNLASGQEQIALMVRMEERKKIQKKKKGSSSNPHDLLDLDQYFDSHDLVDKALKKATKPANRTGNQVADKDDPVFLQKELKDQPADPRLKNIEKLISSRQKSAPVKPAKPDDVIGDNVETEDRLLKIEDVMAILKVGRSSIYKLISSGELPGVKVGTSRRILLKDLNNYIENL